MAMSVGLSIHGHISCPIFTKFPVHITYGHGSFLLWQHCNTFCISGFIDGIMFYHNGQYNWSYTAAELRAGCLVLV